MPRTEFFGGPKDGDRLTLKTPGPRYYRSYNRDYVHAYLPGSGGMEYEGLVERSSVPADEVMPLKTGEND